MRLQQKTTFKHIFTFAYHFAHCVGNMIGMMPNGARLAAVAPARGAEDGCRYIVHIAHQLDGHAKDVIAYAKIDVTASALLIVERLKDVRLEDATVMMYRFEAALAIESITLLAFATGCSVAALAALGLQHDLA